MKMIHVYKLCAFREFSPVCRNWYVFTVENLSRSARTLRPPNLWSDFVPHGAPQQTHSIHYFRFRWRPKEVYVFVPSSRIGVDMSCVDACIMSFLLSVCSSSLVRAVMFKAPISNYNTYAKISAMAVWRQELFGSKLSFVIIGRAIKHLVIFQKCQMCCFLFAPKRARVR